MSFSPRLTALAQAGATLVAKISPRTAQAAARASIARQSGAATTNGQAAPGAVLFSSAAAARNFFKAREQEALQTAAAPKHGAKADKVTRFTVLTDVQAFLNQPEESEVSKKPPSPTQKAAQGLLTKFFGSSKKLAESPSRAQPSLAQVIQAGKKFPKETQQSSTCQNLQQARKQELKQAKPAQGRLAEVIHGKPRTKVGEQQEEGFDREEFELGILAQEHLNQIRSGKLPDQKEFELLLNQFSKRKKPWPNLSNLMDKLSDAYKNRFIEGLKKRIQLFLCNKNSSIEEYQDRMKRASSQVEKEKIKEEWRNVLMQSVPFTQADVETFDRLINILS